MVNPETMATLGTQDTGWRKTKHGKLKKKSVIKLISFFLCLQTFIKYLVHGTVSNCWRFASYCLIIKVTELPQT
jgi:hypothetical protein